MPAPKKARTKHGGATEHVSWTGAVAFANIGFPGAALRGKKWKNRHRPRLLLQFKDLLSSASVIGLCLSEPWSLDDWLSADDRKVFEDLLHEAARASGKFSSTPAQIFWPDCDGETVSIWKPEASVQVLPTLQLILPDSQSYRTVERFRVHYSDSVSLLVFNQHQPASDRRPFPAPDRIRFCSEILRAGVSEHCEESTNIGFVFGGDANCDATVWANAILAETCWQPHFQPAWFAFARDEIADNVALMKRGDCQVGMGEEGFTIVQTNCFVRNRDPFHD